VLKTIRAASRIAVSDKEIIVIDDGSTDGSVDLIDDYITGAGLERNVRLIARDNRGLVKTLNEGLSLAVGRYFYVAASDDIPIPSGIAELVDILETGATLEFAMGNALFMDSEQQVEFSPTYRTLHDEFFALPYKERMAELYLHYPHPILLQSTVIRTSMLRAIGGWREDFISDDFALFLRLFSELRDPGIDFGYFPKIMACFYRQHGTNSHKNIERQFIMVDQALSELCPREWRREALSRNCAVYTMAALSQGKMKRAVRFSRPTIQKVGLFWWLRCIAAEFRRALTRRLSGNRNREPQMTVNHRSAMEIIADLPVQSTEKSAV
jgi:glycosyltransferase involved in cell wall biosynthesis